MVRARVAVIEADRPRGIEIRRRTGRMTMFDRVVGHIFLFWCSNVMEISLESDQCVQ